MEHWAGGGSSDPVPAHVDDLDVWVLCGGDCPPPFIAAAGGAWPRISVLLKYFSPTVRINMLKQELWHRPRGLWPAVLCGSCRGEGDKQLAGATSAAATATSARARPAKPFGSVTFQEDTECIKKNKEND